MVEVNIENIVASTKIADDLDIAQLAESIPDSKYNPKEFPGLILHFNEPKTAILLFSSGKIICTGAKNMKEVDKVMRRLITVLNDNDISIDKKPQMKTQNIVASLDLRKEFHLASIAEKLISEDVEYEPEQFPGLVYRMDKLGVVSLLFSSGKLVCTGASSMEDVTIAVETMTDKLSSIGVL